MNTRAELTAKAYKKTLFSLSNFNMLNPSKALQFLPIYSDQNNMKNLQYVITFVLLLSISSCSRQYKIAKIVVGTTSIETALNLLDEPDVAEKSSFGQDPSHETFIWSDVSLQVKKSTVTAIYRTPASHEKTLQFWKQYYKNDQTNFNKVVLNNKSQESLWKFNIPSKGINVIYNENIDEVTRVIYYEVQ